MKGFKILAVVLVLTIGFYYYRLANAGKNLYFGVGAVKSFSFQNGMARWVQVINVTNSNPIPIPIRSVTIKNFLGTTELGRTYLPKPLLIGGNSTTQMEFVIEIPFSDVPFLATAIADAFKTGKVILTLQGTVNSVGVNLPIKEVFTLPLRK